MQFLADVYDKTLTSMFWTMSEKIQNIMLTMRFSDVFQTINKIPENFTNISNLKKEVNLTNISNAF